MNLSKIELFLAFFIACMFCSCGDAPMKMNEPRNIRGVVSYARTFGDKNDLHLTAARSIGVAAVASRDKAEQMKKKLTRISDSKFYSVDSLTHSIPFLVPRASSLLDKIGKNFLDSLTCKGLNPNKIIVTSVLRTHDDVKKLRKTNINATMTSAHCYGTTFDISWKRFLKLEEKGKPMEDVKAETLKLVLAEVLRDVRKEGLCYIKYELKQGCFHITAR